MNLSHSLLAAALAPIAVLGVLTASTRVQAQYAAAPAVNSAVASPAVAPQVVYSGGIAAPPAYPPQAAYPQVAYPSQVAYPQPGYPQAAYPQAVFPQVADTGATVTPLYTPVTLFNWWRPRTVAGYMVTPTAPVTAYYQPSYHPGGVVVATPPAHAVMSPVVASPPVYASPAVVAPAVVPGVYARPVVGPRQAYLYSRGPLGFPRLDPVPAGAVVQPAAVPFVPVVLP